MPATWTETPSASFVARHAADESGDAVRILDQLEQTRARLAEIFPAIPGNVSVVIHSSPTWLYLAHPYLLIARALTDRSARRYVSGWFTMREIHLLSPRYAREQGGLTDALKLAPSREYARLVVGHNNPLLPPPFRVGPFIRFLRWAWLQEGAAAYFAGQVPHLRAAIAIRLRAGAPSLPPGLRDAALLGGTVFDLLAEERGESACVELCTRVPPGGPARAVKRSFGQPAAQVEHRWREHLIALTRS